MFKIRQAQQDHLARSLVGAALAKGLAGVSRDATFEPNSGRVCVVGQRDQRSYLSLDHQGRIVAATTPLGRTTEFVFEGERLARTVKPTGVGTAFTYGEDGRRRRFERSDGATAEMRFDEAGNLTELTGADGARLRMH